MNWMLVGYCVVAGLCLLVVIWRLASLLICIKEKFNK